MSDADTSGTHIQSEDDFSSLENLEASVIHQRVIEAISDVVPETAKEELADKVVSIITEEIETYSGSVPHPRHAEHWERIVPGAANRILALAEKRCEAAIEQIRIEERLQLADLKRDDNESRRLAAFKMGGLAAGCVVALSMVFGALFAVTQGHLALALALVGASALGSIGYFINSGWSSGSAK